MAKKMTFYLTMSIIRSNSYEHLKNLLRLLKQSIIVKIVRIYRVFKATN